MISSLARWKKTQPTAANRYRKTNLMNQHKLLSTEHVTNVQPKGPDTFEKNRIEEPVLCVVLILRLSGCLTLS